MFDRSAFSILAIAAFAATVSAATAFAQSSPPPDLQNLKSFAGTWRCTGTAFKTQWGPEHPTVATIHVTWILDSYWMQATYAEEKTAKNPHPAAGHAYWGYDPQSKRFVGHAVNNFGGHEAIESDGMKGDTLVWSGNMGGVATRDTFVLKSAKVVTHTTELEIGGQWLAADAETCAKQ